MARDNGATPGYTAPTSADYYVSPTGSDAADGSFATPFKTIRKAASELSGTPGGTIAVRGGVYRQSESLNALTFSSLLRIHRYGNEVPIFSGAEVLTGIAPCTIDDQSYLGANWANCYKADIPSGSLNPSIPPEALNLHEAGNLMMLAVDRVSDEDAAFVDDIHAYHTASNFNDSGGTITQITAASVLSKYTSAQLVGAIASVYTSGNWVENLEITGFNGANTITIDATSVARYDSSARWLFCLKNIGANIKQGGWAFKPTLNGNGSRTVYIWPNDPGNISGGIEFSARTAGIDLANCSNVKIDGITVIQQAGSQDGNLIGIGKLQNRLSVTTNIEISECIFKGLATANLGYGGIIMSAVNGGKIHKNTFDTFTASQPILVQNASNIDITNNYFYRFNSNPIRLQGSTNVFWAWNEHEYGCRMVHSNKISIYIQCDKVAAYANGFTDTYGYATTQESSNIAFIFNRIDADTRPAYADISPGIYAINDQNGGGEPDPAGKLIVLNNSLNPNPQNLNASGGSYSLSAFSGANLDIYDINNTSNGGGERTDSSETILRKNNLLTHQAHLQRMDPSDTYDPNYAATWVNVASGDFTPTPGGNIYTKAGYDASAVMAFVQAWFPTKDFSLDYNGNPVDWNNAFVSSFNPVSGDVTFTAVAMGSVASTNLDAGDQPYSTWGFGDYEYMWGENSPLIGSSVAGEGFIYLDIDFDATQTVDSTPFVTFNSDFSRWNALFIMPDNATLGAYIEDSASNTVANDAPLLDVRGQRVRVIVHYSPNRLRIWGNQSLLYDSGALSATTWAFNTDEWYLMGGIAGKLYQVGLWQTSIDPSNPAAWDPFYDAVSGDAKPLADARAAYGQPIFQIGGDDYNARKEDNDQSGRGNDFGYDGQSIFMQAAAGEAVAIGSVADAVQSAPVQFYAVAAQAVATGSVASYTVTSNVIADAVAGQAVAQGSVANAHYTENVEVNAESALAIATGSTPTFTKTDNVMVDAVAGQAIVIGSTPTYHITDNKTFTAVAGEAVAAGSVPTYELTGNYYATAVAAEAVAIGSVADSNASSDLTFTAIAAEAVATGSIADAEATGNLIFNAVAGEAIAQGTIAEFIATGNIVVSAVAAEALAQGAIAEWSATENHYYTVSPGRAEAIGSIASYDFTANYHATVVAGEAKATGSTPTYTIAQNVTMTANPALVIAYGSIADAQITSFVEPVIDAGVLYSYDFMINLYARY